LTIKLTFELFIHR